MSSQTYLVNPKPAPSLNIPPSSKIVTVRVIDSTTRIGIPSSLLVTPEIKGYSVVDCPSYAFLISHHDRHILFDVGVRKDTGKLIPRVQERIKSGAWTLSVEKNVADILDEDEGGVGVTSKDISAVIWSHHHWDHTGDIKAFPPSAELIVGPKFKEEFMGEERSELLPEDYENRDVVEVDFDRQGNGLIIGGCQAFDFFGDGSFYLLSSEGHSVGHICGFARVSTSPDSFILMGGDAAHHCGEFRPTEYSPLPSNISPSPIPRFGAGCPGELLQKMQRNGRADEAFFEPSEVINSDSAEAVRTLRKLEAFDAADNVLLIIAHDMSLLDRIPLYPRVINNWYKEGLDDKTRWSFIKDFAQAIES